VARTPRRVADVFDMTFSFDAIEFGVVDTLGSVGARAQAPKSSD
jgi:hypothetical protein